MYLNQKYSLVDTANASAHLLLALLPTTGMAAIALYIAVYMWKYGNDASIVVQSTACNGWIFLFLGTLALLGGQVPPEVRHACRACAAGSRGGENDPVCSAGLCSHAHSCFFFITPCGTRRGQRGCTGGKFEL